MSENKNKFIIKQDSYQISESYVVFCIEMYRMLVSCLLLIFIPKKCVDHTCSYSENISYDNKHNKYYASCLILNFFTMTLFFIMYIIELKREHRLINYLEVNKSLPCDNESVGVFLQDLPTHKRNRILYIDKLYQKMAYICITFFVGNTIFSGFIVYDYYLDNQTTTTFVTNVLFMVLKIVDICMTINTDKNIFYSAYLKDKVQYNDVDPREKISNRLCDIVKNDDDENIIVPYKNIQNNRNYNRFIEDVGVELKIFDGVL
jgi:hypothetical protein